jgi:hypothetical protein
MRICFLIASAALIAACDEQPVERRIRETRQRSAGLRRESERLALRAIRAQWHIEGEAWTGRLSDGRLARLHAPAVEAQSRSEGQKLCCSWQGTVMISASSWQCIPPNPEATAKPFAWSCQILMQDSERVLIMPDDGLSVSPPSMPELAAARFP